MQYIVNTLTVEDKKVSAGHILCQHL